MIYTKKYKDKEHYVKEGVLTSEGYLVNEYSVIVTPHEDLQQQIMTEKKNFSETYQCPEAMYVKPRTTLVHFKQHELMEVHIIRQLKNIASTLSPFKVELKDFGSLPSHTIFINMVSKVQVMNIVKSLKASQRLMKLDDENKPHFLTDANVVIARKLLPWQYEKGWIEYEHKHFHERFMADHITLLKRREHTKIWQTVEKYVFENKTIKTEQGNLFS